ncbi:bifunctional DNA primase/polymerase [Pseudonocardia sp. H11422]|uniref:bifunctional DNA primase/polymerase n=1 Tax=Pseudonocardia sp. H11422 TaxID=2835866 RepID=UPI002028E600|nr:bifunctional DNA primase/polymerase [Pseudonocardia sp. H11422]
MLDVALDYAAGGAAVIPLHSPTDAGCSCRGRDCRNIGKHPRTLAGKDDATTDPETIARWWGMWPDANIGIRPTPGLVVVDIDPRNGGDVQFDAMQQRYGQLPRTRTARTGSGGGHLWFRLCGDLRGQLAPGIDIKTSAGYVVAPPSLHASGGVYTWTDAGPIAPAPEFLAALLVRPARAAAPSNGRVTPAVVEGLVRVVREASPGERNRRLYWAAARAHEKGIDPTPLIEAAIDAGLPQREAERTVDSAANAPGGAHR